MNIEYGKPYKYKEICELMGDERITGSAGKKLTQFRKWQQYYDIVHIGRDYYIKRKYTDEEVQLLEPSGKFNTYITDILINYLLLIPDPHITTLTYNEIFLLLNMVNERYRKIKYHIFEELNELKLNLNEQDYDTLELKMIDLEVWRKNSYKLLKQIVNNSLKSMEKKGYIITHKTYKLYKRNIIINDDGKRITTIKTVYPNDEDAATILEIENKVLQSFGLKEKQDLYRLSNKEFSAYRKQVIQEISKEFNDDYCEYSRAFRLLISKTGLEMNLEELKFNNPHKLNENVIKKLLESKEMSLVRKSVNEQCVDKYIKR